MQNTLANAVDTVNSICEFTYLPRGKTIPGMKASEENENRRKILEVLVKKCGGIATFCREYSKNDTEKPISPAFISQLLNGHRTFGEKAARNLEKQTGLEKYYFDQFKEASIETVSANKQELVRFILSLPDDDVDARRVGLIKSSALIDKRFIDGSLRILHAIKEPEAAYSSESIENQVNGNGNGNGNGRK